MMLLNHKGYNFSLSGEVVAIVVSVGIVINKRSPTIGGYSCFSDKVRIATLSIVLPMIYSDF